MLPTDNPSVVAPGPTGTVFTSMAGPFPATSIPPPPASPAAPNIPKPAPIARSIAATFAIILLIGLTVPAGWALPPGLNMLGITVLMSLVLVVLGWAIVGNPLGVLINDLNVMSLSRFQMAAWTVVILAAYYTYVLTRMKLGSTDALNVAIDERLWLLLGISTTSLVGSGLILNTKKSQEPDTDVTKRAAAVTAEPQSVVEANRQGTLYANSDKSDARFTDLFQGDELSNTTHVDLTKVQMFYFTVIAVVAFVLMVGKTLHGLQLDFSHPPSTIPAALNQLPMVPNGLIAILGISHAGYLTGKSVSHTPTQKP